MYKTDKSFITEHINLEQKNILKANYKKPSDPSI